MDIWILSDGKRNMFLPSTLLFYGILSYDVIVGKRRNIQKEPHFKTTAGRPLYHKIIKNHKSLS
jgi:hypothetical protein